jgi:hypothetical protein
MKPSVARRIEGVGMAPDGEGVKEEADCIRGRSVAHPGLRLLAGVFINQSNSLFN